MTKTELTGKRPGVNWSAPVSQGAVMAFYEVAKERLAQDAKFGPADLDPCDVHKMLVVLGEEFGEACQAALAQKGTDKADLRYELVQVAAVAAKMIEMGDAKGWWPARSD